MARPLTIATRIGFGQWALAQERETRTESKGPHWPRIAASGKARCRSMRERVRRVEVHRGLTWPLAMLAGA